jgi:hypothetical protein
MQKHLHIDICSGRRARQAPDHEINVVIAQIAILQLRRLTLDNVESEPRILPRKPVEDGWEQPCHHWFRAADAQFALGRIGQRLQFVDAASQIIAESNAALEQRLAVERGLDAETTALEERNTERLLQARDHFGDDGLRNGETLGGLGHAAVLNDSYENIQLPQLDPPADL